MTPETLKLTPGVWRATLDAMVPYRTGHVEGGCLWYGCRDRRTTMALLVGVPKQVNHPRNFAIPPDALAELNSMVPEDLVVVAQLHSHPGSDTTHSLWDNEMMVSRRAFSLVMPFYAALPCDLRAAGVHVYDGTHWVKLQRLEGHRWLLLEPETGETAQSILVDAR